MTRPVTVNQSATPLAFYRQLNAAQDRLWLDDRVRVRRVVDGSSANSDADVELDFLPTLRDGAFPVRPELDEATIARNYGPTLRCAVGAVPPPGGGVGDIDILIHGYVDAASLSINGASGASGSFIRRTLKVRSIFRRTGRRRSSTIQGRYMLSKTAGDAVADDPPGSPPIDMDWGVLAKRVESLPAIFNFKGEPNRLARPVLFKDPNGWSTGPIHLFTYDGDPDAEPWTFLQALRYAVMVYLPFGFDEQVGPGDLFTSLSASGSESWWDMSEADLIAILAGGGFGTVNTGWRNMMVRDANNLAVEGMNLIEALVSIGKQSGMTVGEVHSNESQNGELRVLSDLDFWVEDQKAADVLALEKGGSHFDAAGNLRTIASVLSTNNVQSANLQLDYGATVASVDAVGDREWWIVRSELVPLWEPDGRWDDVSSANADTFRTDAYSDPFVIDKEGEFFRRYHPQGGGFNELDYRIIGRVWGIDPAGEIDHLTYNRSSGPYVNYDVPYVIPTVGDQVRRRRMIDHPTAKNVKGKRQDVVVEISLDGGDTYQILESAFRLIREHSAIVFRQPNLLSVGREIIEANGTVDNFYDAYLKQALRIRATFAIELDERLTVNARAGSAVSPLDATNASRMVLKPRSYHSRLTDSSVDPVIEARIEEVDDADSLQRYAEAVLTQNAFAKWRGNPVIPWIETSRFGVGTPVQGIIRVPGGGYGISFGGSANRGGGYPHVIQKVYDAEAQTTTLTLRDHSLRKGLSAAL